MDAKDKILINALHGGVPIEDRPYAMIGKQLGMTEEGVLKRLRALLEDRALSRFGPLYDAAKLGGAFTLAAMTVPEERFDEVVEIVNAFPEVAHNYAREHALNMWFVIGVERKRNIFSN
jgi:DNA-binding Lrp family transcriptional regulator